MEAQLTATNGRLLRGLRRWTESCDELLARAARPLDQDKRIALGEPGGALDELEEPGVWPISS